jgi:hypothetical protein
MAAAWGQFLTGWWSGCTQRQWQWQQGRREALHLVLVRSGGQLRLWYVWCSGAEAASVGWACGGFLCNGQGLHKHQTNERSKRLTGAAVTAAARLPHNIKEQTE